ncbi:unnamed protein product [Rotaria magnacalcarata]|uniref:F-box domain-containing protein n=1 Tax=Rotaria magnacalcarata TaxID=392030 RepID=A0A820DLW7_9BILA|nr:unnamed protein product [Rotaria magnacalcarata]CAF2052885.1 unnamed protein product [Rotaria magnacalcarata]CAF2180521.1 unnamed protein product [Rotaria magnacalcarata]CAF3916348.1 unnamed protein product [Rotaria magnacalcarata]CAF4197133.1 unnamed protein product [Rotaria magnacalcarata]
MKHSCVELSDLPDEILLIIFKNLDNLEVLYSFEGVNERLNKIIHDPIFTRHLNFLKWSSNKLMNKFSSNVIHDRFCLQILPEISTKIKWLDLESSSMKYILHAADYPNLFGLGVYNIEKQTAGYLFTDERLSSGIFKNQITTLVIAIDPYRNDLPTMEKLCNHIFTVFINLTHLIFYESSYKNTVRLLFEVPSPKLYSSTLRVLNIKVQSFHICLYLLDGRFSQLHTFSIELANINRPGEEIENQIKIPNLKCFSVSCVLETTCYDELILPLLYRMSNLEKLGLYLSIFVNERFVDGNNLKKNILNRMLQLNQFKFYIHSRMFINNEMNLPSKQDVQQTFEDFKDNQIISYVDYFLERKKGHCHVYSCPFLMKYYEGITNNFPGGLYPYVSVVSLHDENPFEHEFFIRITQSFPFMEKLTLINRHAQNQKQPYKSVNDIQNLSIAKYSYLTELDIRQVHDNYIEEFLCNTKTYLQNDILLEVNFNSLERVTNNFTRDDTRINCGKINEIYLFSDVKYSKTLQNYFPFAKIH